MENNKVLLDYVGCYPSLCFTCGRDVNLVGWQDGTDTTILHNIIVLNVGICSSQNSDVGIKPL